MKLSMVILTLFISSILLISCSNQKNIGPKSIKSKPCEKVDRNPPELTFALHYCMGDLCQFIDENNNGSSRLVRTRDECERIDVIKGDDINKFGQDEISDCEWLNGICIPNK